MTPLCEQWVNLGKGTALVLKRLWEATNHFPVGAMRLTRLFP
jgi:hypothetical protein